MTDSNRLLEDYYRDNADRLHHIVDKILCRFGGISQKDYDDFYSLANEVFAEIWDKYDGSQRFEGFLYSCLSNKIKSEISRRNRFKRQCDREAFSIDMTVSEDGATMGELLVSDFDMEREIVEGNSIYNERIERYLAALSKTQRQIIERRMNGEARTEIQAQLKLSEKSYDRNMQQIKDYDKIRLLADGRRSGNLKVKGEEIKMTVQTAEISKNTSYSIESYIKKLENYSIRGDHPLQRNSNQWSNEQKYNLITTVLNRFPIPEVILAEQVKEDRTENWLIDGKQRLTNLSDYRAGAFKVGRNAERPIIRYQRTLKDEEGKVVFDDNGSPKCEWQEFDVRGKYYEDLPEELKDRFNDYTISAVQYLSCSDDDIEYHIRRYNAAKPMSVAQKGITRLGEQYAGLVKKLSEHPFFKDKANFRLAEFTNGTMDRVVTESIMAMHFLGDWKKKQEDICAYLKENARVSDFEEFGSILDRLEGIVDDETARMFNSKDAFLWFGLFARFIRENGKDEQFVLFMESFRERLHSEILEGQSYDMLCERGTKDKVTVITKIELMEKLMNQFLHGRAETKWNEFKVDDNMMKKYIEEFKAVDIVKCSNARQEADYIRMAVKSLMLTGGTVQTDKKELQDKTAQNSQICSMQEGQIRDEQIQQFLSGKKRNEDEIEDTLLYLAALNDWAVHVDNHSSAFHMDNLPVLIQAVRYVYSKDIEETTAIRWFEKYIADYKENNAENDKKAISAVESERKRYEDMIRSLEEFRKEAQRKAG